MSAPGGGRSFSVFIDLILRGVQQAQGQLNAAVTSLQNLQRGAQGAAGPIQTVDRAITGVGQNSRTASTNVASLGTATTGLARGFAGAAGSTTILNNQIGRTIQETRALSPAVMTVSGGLDQISSAARNSVGDVTRLGAAKVALRENIRSMIFPIGGMIGALNEAAFMSGRSADMDAKLAAAKAEVARLSAIGAQGTTQYARAVEDVDEAQRALNFTNRIATQSWFDVVFFMGSLLGAATGVISRYKELAAGASALSGRLGQLGGVKGKLISMMGNLDNALTGVTTGFTRTNNSAKQLATGMAPIRTGMERTAASAKSVVPAMAGVTSGAALAGGALSAVAASAAAAAGALFAWGGIVIAQADNLYGLGDAAESTNDAFASYIGGIDGANVAGEQMVQGMGQMGQAQVQLMADFIRGVPITKEYINNLFAVEETAGPVSTALVGIADDTKVVAVAMDGTLVPVQDLAKANLDLGATAGKLLEQNGLLGAGMVNLQNGMQVTGETAVLLADAFIKTEQAAIKENQALAQLVVETYGMETAMRLSADQILVLGQYLKDQGVTAKETADSTKELTHAQRMQVAQVQAVTDATNDYNAVALSMQQANLDAIAALTQLGVEFDKNAVAVAATNEGMQEYRTTQIEAFAETRRTAEALGFQGEAYKATTAELLNYIAGAQQQNDVNTEGVDSYLQLSQANREYLATLGLTAQVMGEVSDGTRDLTQQESLLIQVMSGVQAASAANVDGMVELVMAGEDVTRVIGLTNEQIAAELALLEQSAEGHELTAEAIAEHAEAMAELDPMIQQVAKNWGLYSDAQFAATAEGQRLMEGVDELGSRLDSVRSQALEFAIAMGTDVRTAYSMSTEELMNHINSLQDLPPEFETVAQASQRAAQEHLEGWIEAYDGIRAAQEEWASTMTDALQTVGEEFGEELEGIGTDSKEKFAAGIAFDDQFWNEAFPAGMARAAFDKNVDVEDIIEDAKDLIDDAIGEGLITEQQAEESFYPFINWMETNLPEDTRAAMAMLNAAMPELIARFGGTVVEGIGRLDNSTQQAIQSGIVDPAILAMELGFGPQGAAGGLIENVRLLIPRIEGMNPEFAAAFQNALVDPITQQERPFHDQVQRILDIFMLMGEAGKPMVEALDADLSGVPDILEQNIVTPVEQTRTELNAQFIAIVSEAAAGASQAGEAWKNNWNSSMSGWVPRQGVASALDFAVLEGAVAGADTSQKFIDTANSGFSSWVPRNQVEPQLNTIPPIATDVATKSVANWGSAMMGLPTQTAPAIQATADEFAGLKTALQAEADLIAIAVDAIAQTFVNLKNVLNGPQALGGIDFSIIATNINAQLPTINAALTNIQNAIVVAAGTWMIGWINHFSAVKGYIPVQLGLITQVFTQYMALVNTAVMLGLSNVMLSWVNHFTTLSSTIPVQLGMISQVFTQYMALVNTAVILGLGNVMLSWLTHFSVLNTTIPTQLGLTAQVFTTYMGLIRTAVILGLGTVMLAWLQHFTALAGVVNGQFATIIGTFNTWLAAATSQTLTQTTQMSIHWVSHAASVGSTVGTIIGHMATLGSATAAVRGQVLTQTTQMSAHWVSHASSVGSSVRTLVGQMAAYASAAGAARGQILTQTTQMSAHWVSHGNSVRSTTNQLNNTITQMVNSARSRLSSLASAVTSTMSRIVSAMNRATAAANTLRAAINRLQNKNITVTTRYRTVGTPARAARGFNGVVNKPTNIHVGEGGRPELVSIAPLQGTAGAHHNGLAALRKAGMSASSTLKAARGFGVGGEGGISGSSSSSSSNNNNVSSIGDRVNQQNVSHTPSTSIQTQTTTRSNSNTVRRSSIATATSSGGGSSSSSSSNRQVVVVGGSQPIENRIYLDGMELKRWIRKVSNEGYDAMR